MTLPPLNLADKPPFCAVLEALDAAAERLAHQAAKAVLRVHVGRNLVLIAADVSDAAGGHRARLEPRRPRRNKLLLHEHLGVRPRAVEVFSGLHIQAAAAKNDRQRAQNKQSDLLILPPLPSREDAPPGCFIV